MTSLLQELWGNGTLHQQAVRDNVTAVIQKYPWSDNQKHQRAILTAAGLVHSCTAHFLGLNPCREHCEAIADGNGTTPVFLLLWRPATAHVTSLLKTT